MNNRTEAKLTDLSGMQKAIEETLKQAWERKECNDDCNKRSNYIFPDPDDN